MKPAEIRELLHHAEQARALAHAPYSRYRVGAALLSPGGNVWLGANVENASLGLSVCAERTAVWKAVTEGERKFLAIAISTEDGGAPVWCLSPGAARVRAGCMGELAGPAGPHRQAAGQGTVAEAVPLVRDRGGSDVESRARSAGRSDHPSGAGGTPGRTRAGAHPHRRRNRTTPRPANAAASGGCGVSVDPRRRGCSLRPVRSAWWQRSGTARPPTAWPR